MPWGTAFHSRTSALCESMSWREWAGYYAVSTYEVHHEREYSALRNAAGLIDISPLFKYRLAGPDATRLVDRIVTRDMTRVQVGQVVYTHWCDGEGKVIDDGTVSRLDDQVYRWTAAEPNLRWLTVNAHGLDVRLEEITERTAALALQGPTSRSILEACVEVPAALRALKYFRVMSTRLGGIPVDISRTGYTGDLGYEVWVDAGSAEGLWDTLMEAGHRYDITPAGMLALDVARIEAGLILLDVDYTSAKKALIPSQKYTPAEIGLGRLVHLEKAPFIGQAALRDQAAAGPARQLVGLEVDWDGLERLYDEVGLPPQLPATASRVSVPIYAGEAQVGRATSSTWSPTLKKMIALASIASPSAGLGKRLEMEWTVEHQRKRVNATVVKLPFFDPPRKRA